jgi:phosphatidylglycerophosphate synthase
MHYNSANAPFVSADDRRPIAARDRRPFQTLAGWLARHRVSPNVISVAGLVAGVAGGVTLAATAWWPEGARLLWLASAVLVQLRLLANMLDGMVAVESERSSPLGHLYNEVPDRVSDAAILIGLGCAAGGSLTLGFIATCLALFVAYIRAEGRVAVGRYEFCGPMAKPHRMFTVTLAAGLCAVAPDAGVATMALVVIVAGTALTAVRRLCRLARVSATDG